MTSLTGSNTFQLGRNPDTRALAASVGTARGPVNTTGSDGPRFEDASYPPANIRPLTTASSAAELTMAPGTPNPVAAAATAVPTAAAPTAAAAAAPTVDTGRRSVKEYQLPTGPNSMALFKAYYSIPDNYVYNERQGGWVDPDYGAHSQPGSLGRQGRAVIPAPAYTRDWTLPGFNANNTPGTDTGTGTGTTSGTPATVYTPPLQQQPIAVVSPGTAAVPGGLAPVPATGSGGLQSAANLARVQW